jgi:hypothetical protein
MSYKACHHPAVCNDNRLAQAVTLLMLSKPTLYIIKFHRFLESHIYGGFSIDHELQLQHCSLVLTMHSLQNVK